MGGSVSPRLVLVNDLPPRWDGQAVVWNGWQRMPVMLCMLPDDSCCEACGSDKNRSLCFGLLADDDGMTARDVRTNDAACRVGATTRRSWIRLTAYRCPDCGHDQVDDGEDVWNLDPDDYTDAGSHAVDPAR